MSALTVGMTTARWMTVPIVEVPVADLVPVQDHLTLSALLHGGDSRDPFPHVVSHGGRMYLEDGHHRYARAVLRAVPTLFARLLHRPCAHPLWDVLKEGDALVKCCRGCGERWLMGMSR